jgi:ribonuclease R
VTIDGEDARDFDDAVYAEANAGGFRLVVAIADVSHYVRPGSGLDAESRDRATSVYFPSRVLPMLPEELSNHLCSLMPDVERLCMVCEMEVTRAGSVAKSRFYDAVMRSQARFTYTRVAAHLEGREPLAGSQARLAPVVDRLHDVYRALRPPAREARRARLRGARGQGAGRRRRQSRPTSARIPRNDAHRLIEECMIAANVEAAAFLKKRRLPALFRIHGKPDEERIEELKRFLSMRGVHLDIGGDLKPARLQRCSPASRAAGRGGARERHHPLAAAGAVPAAQHRALRPRARRIRALHLADRRYPDLLVHRGIRHALRGGTARTSPIRRARWRRSAPSVHCASGGPTRRRARWSLGSSASSCARASARSSTPWSRASPSSAPSCS